VAATLATLFGSAPDERAVLSVCAVGDGERWRIVHGTLLIVPEDIAAVSWSRSRATERVQKFPPELCVAGDGWLLARTVVALDHAEAWFGALRALDGSLIELAGTGEVPPLLAEVQPPRMLLRVVPEVDSPVSSLIAGLARPVDALLFPGGGRQGFPELQFADVDGVRSFLPATDLAGIHVTKPGMPAELSTACGVLVGRAERRAWIIECRGTGDFEQFRIDLGWDPHRIDLSQLELLHEELLDRDLAAAARIRLEDLDLEAVREQGEATVLVPTIGRSVRHRVTLSTVDGEVLDISGPYPIAERVSVSVSVGDKPLPPIVTGVTSPPPGLDERLERREAIERDIRALVHNAAQSRVIAERETGWQRLVDLLSRARGELLVQDRYFGQDVEDWRLLDAVPVPTRVLTGKIAEEIVPVIAPHVQARFRARAPLHERVYLWEGGGLIVGGSPTTFGQAPVSIMRMRVADVDVWRVLFEAQWASPLYHEVPREPS
jgi:hypothetical protein